MKDFSNIKQFISDEDLELYTKALFCFHYLFGKKKNKKENNILREAYVRGWVEGQSYTFNRLAYLFAIQEYSPE